MSLDNEVVLKVGAEGGDVTLVGRRALDGAWQFARATVDQTEALFGEGGEVILEGARQVLRDEFPELAERVRLRTPDEKDKRHGQAIAAASLPVVPAAKAATKAPRKKR